MANYLIRVGLPDRPGALGAVASRIGAVGGDVVSIDILQRDEGVVVDELGVVLAGDDLIELVRTEILEVDGVVVESVRSVDGPLRDRHAVILEVATTLFRQTTPTGVIEYLATQVRRSLGAVFAVALDPAAPWPVAGDGEVPGGDDLRCLVEGALDAGQVDVTGGLPSGLGRTGGEVAAVGLVRAGLVLVIGRTGLPFRAREHQWVSAMAELADHRWSELTDREPIGAIGRVRVASAGVAHRPPPAE